MNVAEMIDATIANGGDGDAIIKMLIEYGHLPYDANERPAGQTTSELRQLGEIRHAIGVWFKHVDNNDIARSMTAAEALKVLGESQVQRG